MDASQLTPQQAAEIYLRVRDAFDYLAKLQRRMEEREFYRGDRLYLEVVTARHSVQLLADDLHRMACGAAYTGTVKPPPTVPS